MPAEENEGILFCALAKRFLFNVSILLWYQRDAAPAAIAVAVIAVVCLMLFISDFVWFLVFSASICEYARVRARSPRQRITRFHIGASNLWKNGFWVYCSYFDSKPYATHAVRSFVFQIIFCFVRRVFWNWIENKEVKKRNGEWIVISTHRERQRARVRNQLKSSKYHLQSRIKNAQIKAEKTEWISM